MLALDDQHDGLVLRRLAVDCGHGAQALDLVRRPVLLLAVRRAVQRAPAQGTLSRCLAVAIRALRINSFLRMEDTCHRRSHHLILGSPS